MIPEQRHSIRKQTVTVALPPPANTAALQAWSEWSRAQLPDILQRVLDEHVDAKTYIALDNLSVNIMVTPGASVQEAVAAALPQALAEALRMALPSRGVVRSEAEQAWHWFRMYLTTGTLPWSAPRTWNAATWERLLLSALAAKPAIAASVLAGLAEDANALERLLQTFSPALRWQLLAAARPTVAKVWTSAQRANVQALPLSEQVRAWQKILASRLVRSVSLSAQPDKVDVIVTEASLSAELEVDALSDSFFVADAGIVLLAPYLTRLLEALLGGRTGVEQARGVAVHILHYLVHGQQATAEWELVLPKLLCGWPIDKAVAMDVALPAATEAECRQLLEAVIGHWQVLKNTSVEGLRTAFLQREGKLTRTDDHWQLQVEQQPQDLLLAHVPWGFGILLLPWMEARILVDWQ